MIVLRVAGTDWVSIERRALQIAVAAGSLVPIAAGLAGVLRGPAMMGEGGAGPAGLDSQFRYLSGLLLGIGIGYATTVPRIERRRGRFLLLTAIVVVGGIGRLAGAVAAGAPAMVTLGALAMELAVAPALALWQRRIARLDERERRPLMPAPSR